MLPSKRINLCLFLAFCIARYTIGMGAQCVRVDGPIEDFKSPGIVMHLGPESESSDGRWSSDHPTHGS